MLRFLLSCPHLEYIIFYMIKKIMSEEKNKNMTTEMINLFDLKASVGVEVCDGVVNDLDTNLGELIRVTKVVETEEAL